MPPPLEFSSSIVSTNKQGEKKTVTLSSKDLRARLNAEHEQTQSELSTASASVSASNDLLTQQTEAAQKLRDHQSGATKLSKEEVESLLVGVALSSYDAQLKTNSAVSQVVGTVGRESNVSNGMHNAAIGFAETACDYMSRQAQNQAELANLLNKTTPKSAAHKEHLENMSRAAFDLVPEATQKSIRDGASDLKPQLSIKSSADSPAARSSSKSKPLAFTALSQNKQDEITAELVLIPEEGIKCKGCKKIISREDILKTSMDLGSVQKYHDKTCKTNHTSELAKAKEDAKKEAFTAAMAESKSRVQTSTKKD